MNKYLLKNISLIIKIFLFIQPVIDIVTSIMINYFNISITLGMIFRILFMLFIIYFYLFVKKGISKFKLYYLLTILIFTVIYTISILINKGNNVLFSELSNYIKIIYFIILITLIDKEDINIKLNDLVYLFIIYTTLILIPNILNISFNSYTQGKVGSVGLFNSGNEISAIISILTPFIIYYLFNKNNNYLKILLITLIVLTYFQMGSKIVIISLILSIIFNIIISFKKNKTNLLIIGISLLIIIILSIIIIPRTNFYYNIVLHLNYLGINNISDIFTYNFINRFIFSDRLSFLSITNSYFINSNIIEKLFGIGSIINPNTDYIYIKSIEMDLFDIFYYIGIIGFIIYLIPLIKNIKELSKNKIIIFSVILSLIIATLVGHTLVAPAVSIYVVILFKMGDKI